MYNFEFERPRSVDDAVQSLGGEALALGGGQTLIPALKQRLNQPDKLVSLTGISELNGISMLSDGRLSVKGATTHIWNGNLRITFSGGMWICDGAGNREGH